MKPLVALATLLALAIPGSAMAQLQEAPSVELLCKPEEGCFETRFSVPSTPDSINPPAIRARAAGAFGSGLFAQVTDSSNSSLALGTFTAGRGSAGLFAASGAGDPVLRLQTGPTGPREVARDFLHASRQGATRFRLFASGGAYFAGDIHAKGHVFLFAREGESQSGTAYVQARDDSNADIALRLRTQNKGSVVEALHIRADGDVGIGTTDPEGHRLKVEGSAKVTGDLTVDGTAEVESLAADGRIRHGRVSSWSEGVSLGQSYLVASLGQDAALVVELAIGWEDSFSTGGAGGCYARWVAFINEAKQDASIQVLDPGCTGQLWGGAGAILQASDSSLRLKVPQLASTGGSATPPNLVDATVTVRSLYGDF